MSPQRDLVGLGLAVASAMGAAGWVAYSNAKLEARVESLAKAVSAIQAAPATPAAPGTELQTNVLLAEIRRGFAELAQKKPSAGTEPAKEAVPSTGQSTEPSPAPVGPEAIEAFEGANALLERALARRSWTEEDRSQLQALTSRMDAQSRVDVVERLVRSVNEGKLKPEGGLF